ncbi:MAG: exopolysaccharide biosynthesis polyprenyl glycosylphosphotransferase [Verrucomicrobiales bacterium]|jgi:exopolysaccharide biosynthesis polyprenyl glycosylphosphotransferase
MLHYPRNLDARIFSSLFPHSMAANGLINRHWIYVARHLATDFVLFVMAFFGGTFMRFTDHENWLRFFGHYLPAVVFGGLVFSCLVYIVGLYAPLRMEHAMGKRFGRLTVCLLFSLFLVVAVGYIDWSSRIGRGVMTYSVAIVCVLTFLHHFIIYRRSRHFRERVVFIVNDRFDASEARAFASFGAHLDFVGLVGGPNFESEAGDDSMLLGSIDDIEEIIAEHRVKRVLCTTTGMDEPKMRRVFCQLRYSGITVVSLISLCEEIYQFVPIEFVCPSWLLGASDAPQMLYIKKVKRAFDIIVSSLGLLFLGPFMLLGMAAVKLGSNGPIFYRQIRLGRFGKHFEVLKLRSMVVDAEKDGAQWSAAGNDPRSTGVGKILRRYRIDEIPQLINVFRGEMSFVGPRPERPEFVERLAEEIPYFQERLLVQPGITGWAQVNYPYGATTDDSRRKLEYDLYYMKHMSLFLDAFIILDTFSIILRGGLDDSKKVEHPVSKAILEHYRSADSELRKMTKSISN